MPEASPLGSVELASPPLPPPPPLPEFSATPAPERHPRRGLVIAVIIAGVVALVGLVVWAAVAGFLPFGPRRRLSDAEIVGRALQNFAAIRSGTVRVDTVFKTEPRAPDAKPITFDTAARQAKQEALKRDQERLEEVRSIIEQVNNRSSFWQSSQDAGATVTESRYPVRLDAVVLDPNERTDPSGSAYVYQSDGQTFSLTFRLETAKAVSGWNQQLNAGRQLREGATPFPKAAVGQDIVLTQGMEAPAVFLASVTSLDSLTIGGEDSSFLFQLLPSDLEVNFNVRSDYATLPSGELVPNFSTGIGGKVVAGGLSFAGDGELRKVGENFYGRVNEFPSLGFFDLHAVKGQWVALTPEDLIGSSWAEGWVVAQEQSKESAELFRQHEELFLEMLSQQQVVTVAQALPVVTEDGSRFHHYRLALDRAKFAAFYRAFVEQAKAKFGSRALLPFNPDVAAAFDDEEFTAMYDAISPHLTLELWVHAKTFMPRRLTAALRLVPPDSLAKFSGKQFLVSLGMTLDRVNQPVQVDAPSPTISLDDATALITGQSAAEITLQRQIRQVEAVRQALARYHRRAGQHPETLLDLKQRPSQVTAVPSPLQVNEQLKQVMGGPSVEDFLGTSDAPFLTVIPVDVYTRQSYGYQREGESYALRYQVKLPPEQQQSGQLFQPIRNYRDGENTADPNTLSREAATSRDSDGDGLLDDDELRYGTDTFNKDSDGDGYEDGVEVKNGFDPTSKVPGKKFELLPLPPPGPITISPEDLTCMTDTDCTSVTTVCGGCDCGTAVNRTSLPRYEAQRRALCERQRGPECMLECQPMIPRCYTGRCSLSLEQTTEPPGR